MGDDEEWVLAPRPAERNVWSSGLVEDDSRPLKLTFAGPAKHWTDAVPIGAGRIGAMVWGGVATEVIQLNEDTLWTGIPGNYTNAKAPEALSRVRKLVDGGKYSEASDAALELSDDSPDVYQPLGDIRLEFDDSHLKYVEKTYQRELDLDTATVKVKYVVGDVEFTREHFASFPDQAIVMKISGNKSASLSFVVYLDCKLDHNSHVNGGNQIILEGSCPGKRTPLKVSADDKPEGIHFSAILDVQISDENGVIQVLDNNKLKVEDSDWAVLRLVASSSFDGPFTKPSESRKDPDSDSLRMLTSVKQFSYSELYARHLDDFQNIFHRVSLTLSKSAKSVLEDRSLHGKKYMSRADDLHSRESEDITVPTAARVKSFQTDEDPSLVELLFHYGRYLLISSSRPGTQVANLQGIWNDRIDPPWDCAQHLNINLQMNYWPSFPCNLRECQEPLYDYISSLSINGSKTAKVNYETSGWVAHQVTDLWAKTSPDKGDAVWAMWPVGGAWLCTHLWECYMYTLDKDFLKNKAYPLLEGCVSFLLDWLIEGRGGFLETNPSTSPEHKFIAPDGKQASVSYSTTMDMEIINEVFSAIVSAAEILGRSDDEIVQKVREAQPKLPPIKIARDGSIMEWAQDFEDPEVHHRHVSHLFGLYPGHTITIEKNPGLCKAADYTLYKRGEDGPAWSTMWKANLWARLHNSEHAYRMVKHLFILVDPDNETAFEGGLYSNLFTAHPPFQIDGNFGFAAAVAEMLVQGTLKDLYLLPALPRDKWANGCAKGLRARGGVTVNISWKEGDLYKVGIWSKEHNLLHRLHYRGTTVTANILAGRVYTFNRKLVCLKTYALSKASFC